MYLPHPLTTSLLKSPLGKYIFQVLFQPKGGFGVLLSACLQVVEDLTSPAPSTVQPQDPQQSRFVAARNMKAQHSTGLGHMGQARDWDGNQTQETQGTKPWLLCWLKEFGHQLITTLPAPNVGV